MLRQFLFCAKIEPNFARANSAHSSNKLSNSRRQFNYVKFKFEGLDLHKAELLQNWELSQSRQQLTRINPLRRMKLIRVIEAKYLEGYKISLQFTDGTIGIADLEEEKYILVFEPLKNIGYFKKFTLNTWTICWPNGFDLSAEFLYELASKNQAELVKK